MMGHFIGIFQISTYIFRLCLLCFILYDEIRSDEAGDLADKMIGHKLITKQTGEAGRPCNKVMVEIGRAHV